MITYRTPPPDLPSLLLKERIVYLGMPLTAVTELIIAELLYLQYEDPDKPIKFTSTLPALLVTTANRLVLKPKPSPFVTR